MLIRTLLCTALLAVAATAGAQQPQATSQSQAQAAPASQQLTPEQREAMVKFRKAMVANAESVLQLIDQGHVAQVWDNGSSAMKQVTTRDKFVSKVEQARKPIGKVESRKLLRMYRTSYAANNKDGTPPGTYLNIQFLSRFANAKQPMIELVSYHFDTQTTPRVSGYVIDQAVQRKPAANANANAKR